MRYRFQRLLLLLGAVVALAMAGVLLLNGWHSRGPLTHEISFIVPEHASLTTIAERLDKEGAIRGATLFRLRARLFGHGKTVKAGEFLLPARVSEARILAILSGNEALRRFVTVPEGLPSIMVAERLEAQPFLSGTIAVPAEGSVLPETYDFRPGESRQAVLARMQAGMSRLLDQLWAARAPGLPLHSKRDALILASIVEKETGKSSERGLVAGLYENRLRKGMMLQADPTIIYPITKGKPLGRRIRQSEITAVNGYNTYTKTGLPAGPITNPGKASLEAVLHPATTQALYMVADGTGGHVFADTLEEHNRNVARWFAIRRARGDL